MFMVVQSARGLARGGFYAASARAGTGAAAFIRGNENAALWFCPETRLSGLENSENLSLRDDIVQLDEDGFEFSGSRR